MKYFVWLSAISLAICSAMISIIGLSKLFAGGIIVTAMISALELSKLVTASALHRYWDKIELSFKLYMTTGLAVMIMITSLGIYGHLSNEYQKNTTNYNAISTEIKILTDANSYLTDKITTNDDVIKNKLDEVAKLTNIRDKQEDRVDDLIVKNNIKGANRIRNDISKTNSDINRINSVIDSLTTVNNSTKDSLIKLSNKTHELEKSGESSSELGPLVYISKITGKTMDAVVNILILIIIFVFDPMAIILLILANKISLMEAEPVLKPTSAKEAEPEIVNKEVDEPVSIKSAPRIEREKREAITPTGQITANDITKIKDSIGPNRGFSVDIPKRNTK